MFINLIVIGCSAMVLIVASSAIDDQTQEIMAARCYSKCLQIHIRYKSAVSTSSAPSGNLTSTGTERGVLQLSFVDEMANQLLTTKQALTSCLADDGNRCSKQCIQFCSTMGECICQQSDIGCMLACHYRKEISKESIQDECLSVNTVEEIIPKPASSQCPKACKSKFDCNANQACCSTETCGSICVQVEKRKFDIPKYKPNSTQPNTSVNIEFDWSSFFKPYINKDSPLVFVLQIRSCLCHNFDEKYATSWQTLIRTHLLGVKLNTFEKGTIYQFRLAAVNQHGTNGFGPVSQNLPTVISKPPPPLPPEDVIDYKWQITDESRFRVEIKWKKSVDPFWRVYEYLVSWMVDHGVAQPDGEPLSSLTQYSKTLLGTEESCTIDELKPSATYKIQIVVRAYWPGYGNIVSVPNTMYITTPATSGSTDINSEVNPRNKECSCPEKTTNALEPKIRQPQVTNRNLQVVIDMQQISDYSVNGYPEVCIHSGNENFSKSAYRFYKEQKNTAQITLTNLRFNCRYSIDVISKSPIRSNSTYHLCFCTPSCNSNNPYHAKFCHKEDLSIPSPKEPKSALFDIDTMTYKISWKPSFRIMPRNRIFDITKYRISWGPRKFEPVRIEHYLGLKGFNPIVDFDQSDVKIVHSNITGFLLHNLTRQQLYVVRIQSLGLTLNGDVIESYPATILLPTAGYSDEFLSKSSQKLCLTQLTMLIFGFLYHQMFSWLH